MRRREARRGPEGGGAPHARPRRLAPVEPRRSARLQSPAHARAQWNVTAHADGRWSFQSAHGYYFSGTGDKLHAFAREIGETEKWTIHLAMHPQVAIRNVNRRRYVHLANGELQVNEDIPWGDDALLTIEFHNGRYSFRGANNKFLSKGGKMVESVTDDCLFIIEFFESKVAFKANDGKYLQGYGSQGVLCARRNTVGKDELFELEDSHPQAGRAGRRRSASPPGAGARAAR